MEAELQTSAAMRAADAALPQSGAGWPKAIWFAPRRYA